MPEDQAELLRQLHRATRIPAPELVQQINKGAFTAEAVGHADITDILLAHDPCWSWAPLALDESGLPKITMDKSGRLALWANLTIFGHTRLEVGTSLATSPDPLKELVGDFLRRGAMRFGVSLKLWSKSEWREMDAAEPQPGERTQRETRGSATKENAPRAGKSPAKVSQLPRPTDADVARHPSAEGPLLRQDQAIAARAAQLGLDDTTRVDVIRAVAGPEVTSGKAVSSDQAAKVMRQMRWLADGFVELRYDEEGVPTLVDAVPANPGPPT